MSDDSAIVFRVDADDKEAQKKLSALRRDIEKTAQAINNTNAKHNGIVEALQTAKNEAAQTAAEIERVQAAINANTIQITEGKFNKGQAMIPPAEYERLKEINNELLEKRTSLQEQLKGQQAEVQKLEAQEKKVLSTLNLQTEQLDRQKVEAGRVEQAIAKQASETMPSAQKETESVNDAVRGGVKSIIKWGVAIGVAKKLVKGLINFTKQAVSAFIAQDAETQASVNGIRNALNTLKISWGAAFAPIINAVAPLIQTLIGWLTTAANAVARFFAVVAGKTSYKKAIAGNEALADSYGSAGAAAKEAEKQITSYDEINKLSDNSSSGGGGGGGGASAADLIEEAINQDSLASRLAIAAKDVLFKWDDLTQEDIIAKAIAGLAALGGMIVGGSIGGIPGAIIGLAAGLAFGILMDGTIFNFDGTLSQDELWNALKLALGGIGGAVIGLTIGGPLGAAIGLLLGLGIAFAGITIDFEPLRTKIDEWATSVKNYFLGYINKWKERGSDQANSVGLYIVGGILEGLIMGVINIGKKIYDSVIKPIIDFFKNGFQINSPSKVMEEIGGFMIDGLWSGIEQKWNAFRSWLSGSWNSLRSWWSGLSLGSFPFRLPHIQVDWQMLSADSVLARFLGFTAIPHLSVAWYARGGIVDGATLIGAGEQGKEAIIPLERNTGWIKQVAQELLSAMETKYKGALVGMPAMAMGGVVPPRAISESSSIGITEEDVASIIRGVTNAFSSAPMHFDFENRIYLDGRQIASNITRHQRELQRAAGE